MILVRIDVDDEYPVWQQIYHLVQTRMPEEGVCILVNPDTKYGERMAGYAEKRGLEWRDSREITTNPDMWIYAWTETDDEGYATAGENAYKRWLAMGADPHNTSIFWREVRPGIYSYDADALQSQLESWVEHGRSC